MADLTPGTVLARRSDPDDRVELARWHPTYGDHGKWEMTDGSLIPVTTIAKSWEVAA